MLPQHHLSPLILATFRQTTPQTRASSPIRPIPRIAPLNTPPHAPYASSIPPHVGFHTSMFEACVSTLLESYSDAVFAVAVASLHRFQIGPQFLFLMPGKLCYSSNNLFLTLMPCAKDAITHVEQQSKFFMIMTFIRLPSELESSRNQILSSTSVHNYDTVSEQLLCLDISHAFDSVSSPSYSL